MIRNLLEDHVAQAYADLKPHFRGFCGCEVCHADVMVFALNRLPARYVGSLEGHVVSEVFLEKQQSRAEIDVIVLDGFRRVMASPRCGRAPTRPT